MIKLELFGGKKMDKRFGHYSFAIGVLLAIILGLANSMGFSIATQATLTSLLVVLGIVIGAMNITGKETREFLISAVVLVITASLSVPILKSVAYVGVVLVDLFGAILAVTVPAVIIVSVKNIWRLAKTK